VRNVETYHHIRKVQTVVCFFCFKYPSLLFYFTLFVRSRIHVGRVVGNPRGRQKPHGINETEGNDCKYAYVQTLRFYEIRDIGISSRRGVKRRN